MSPRQQNASSGLWPSGGDLQRVAHPLCHVLGFFYPPEGDITGVILEFKYRKGCSV